MTVSTFFRMLGGIAMLTCMVQCADSESTPQTSTTSTSADAQTKQGAAYVQDDESEPTVLHIAAQSDDHTILVEAVKAAGLENSLVNQGPLMVFAPTNAAFEELPDGTMDDLLKQVNQDRLKFILQHHVTPGNYNVDLLKKFDKLGQANNQNVMVEVKGEDVYVGGARIITSIPASNGIIHVIDKVMLPPSE